MRLLSVFVLMMLMACKAADKKSVPQDSVRNDAPYQLDQPQKTLVLDAKLQEISAVAYQDNALWAVQDELGTVFQLSPEDGSIVNEKPFGSLGDYEGLEWINGGLYVLKSNGELFKDGLHLKAELPKKCDAEGLGYHANSGELLIACKGKVKGKSTIQHFQLNENQTLTFKSQTALDEKYSLSGLATHPTTGELWMTSSKPIGLVHLGVDGATSFYPLPDYIAQPEGITFAPNGTMYISDEGVVGAGRIYVYTPKN